MFLHRIDRSDDLVGDSSLDHQMTRARHDVQREDQRHVLYGGPLESCSAISQCLSRLLAPQPVAESTNLWLEKGAGRRVAWRGSRVSTAQARGYRQRQPLSSIISMAYSKNL